MRTFTNIPFLKDQVAVRGLGVPHVRTDIVHSQKFRGMFGGHNWGGGFTLGGADYSFLIEWSK